MEQLGLSSSYYKPPLDRTEYDFLRQKAIYWVQIPLFPCRDVRGKIANTLVFGDATESDAPGQTSRDFRIMKCFRRNNRAAMARSLVPITSLFSTTRNVLDLYAVPLQRTGRCSSRAGADHSNCAAWSRNSGFCTDASRPLVQRQAFCPVTCTYLNCPAAGKTTTTAKPSNAVENINCVKWAANVTAPYCLGTTSVAQKALFCPKTCDFEIKPTADCVLYLVTDNKFARGTPLNRQRPRRLWRREQLRPRPLWPSLPMGAR
ncbi:hypothetical protein PMAYCL1PPCAC_16348 [Pristionchus mayeri]|uniref:ShKT domain-containing protein n=1 Tax=Pristionchus mayeri TaxID=1317129 RepID=A0AAN5HZ50_9BILA|nr:hypothetical protein PMAYCL1PPCAC_16348 [Pristionchus mayeri]